MKGEIISISDSIMERLRCGMCGALLTVEPGGSFACPEQHSAIFADGFLDACPESTDQISERTFDSFGYEWNAFDTVEPEDEEFWQVYFKDVSVDELSDKIGLDAGCGKGRYTFFTARHLGELVAMDGSSAVKAAVRNLASLGNVTIVRADLRNSPFAPASFDFVSCLGVLHHLPDPEEGFRKLLDLLVPGGLMLIYVYSRPDEMNLRSVALHAANLLRRVTVRMPFRILKTVAVPIAAFLYTTFVMPGHLGDRFGYSFLSSLPLGTYRGKPLRSLWLDTFDRLSAPVENRYIWPELQGWFERSSSTVLAARDEAGWFITLRKAASPRDQTVEAI